ncbi:MAG TPA: pyridoxamine 5'-phosphate oxidase family protein, partial [Methanoregula sp.]|nr:pyridoxamine 5'-phosphate oxidase family protein [Methanoregula sp.]
MLRKDREITDRKEMEAVLQAAPVCRLAMVDGDEPYVVPLCFGYESGSFFFHSALEGRKIDILRKNPRVCIEADSTGGAIRDGNPCSWGMRYTSVI